MNNWFNVKVKFTFKDDDGNLKKATQNGIFNAVNFSDAETRAITEFSKIGNLGSEISVLSISRNEISSIIDNYYSDFWYEVKIQFELLDTESEKSKKIINKYMVTSNSIELATLYIKNHLDGQYEIVSVRECKNTDVYPLDENRHKEFCDKCEDEPINNSNEELTIEEDNN